MVQGHGDKCEGPPSSVGGGELQGHMRLSGEGRPLRDGTNGLFSATSMHCHLNSTRYSLSVRITLLLTLRKNTWQIDTILTFRITPSK